MKESQFQALLVRQLREAGALVLNLIPDERMGKNWPDIHVVHRRWSGWIELKSGMHRAVTPGQKQMVLRLIDRDMNAFILRLENKRISEEIYDPFTGKLIESNYVMTSSQLGMKNGGAKMLELLSMICQ